MQGRGDVASLVRNLLGPIYGDGVINLLIRQARDILVCAYHGNLENFLKTYLSPAATLLAEVKSAAASEMVSITLLHNSIDASINFFRNYFRNCFRIISRS